MTIEERDELEDLLAIKHYWISREKFFIERGIIKEDDLSEEYREYIKRLNRQYDKNFKYYG